MGEKITLNPKSLVFIDRDGVLIDEVTREDGTFGSIRLISDFKLKSGVKNFFKFLNKLNVFTVIVSNQSDINKGFISNEFVTKVNRFLIELLNINMALWCPHQISDSCNCRKPKIGMFEQFITKEIKLKNIYFIGDRISDMEVAEKLEIVGIHFITNSLNCNDKHFHAKNFNEITQLIKYTLN